MKDDDQIPSMTPTEKTWFSLGGIALMLLSVWGGTWLIDVVPCNYKFAAHFTAVIPFLIGVVFVAVAIVTNVKSNDDK